MSVARRMSALALMFAVACSGGTPEGEGSRAAGGTFDVRTVLRPDGPLGGLALTGHLDRRDQAIRPTLSFTSNDTEATAVVGLGNVPEGSTLTVTWYRLTGIDEREPLFSHRIAVGPGGEAFSQAIAAGGLAPGTYETVATMGEFLVHTPWVVREVEAASTDGTEVRAMGAPAASEDEPWNTPESGNSGWDDPQTPPASPPPPGPCEVASVHANLEPLTTATGSVYWIGQCTRMALAATISGPAQEVASEEVTDGSQPFLPGRAPLCELPGASDLPGTVVNWTASGSDGATGSATFTVPDFGETLEAIIQAAEGTPSRVDPGFKIELRGMALVIPPALGIKELSLFAGDQLIQTVGNASGSDAPQPCDPGRLGAVNRAQYTVPADPPPVIEICAEAVGFDRTKSRSCIEFYTGEVWKGEVTGEAVQPKCSPPSLPLGGQLTMSVASDGTVTGTVTEKRPPFTCAGTGVPPFSETYDISGKKTPEAFEVAITGTGQREVTIPITGTEATATFDEVTGGYGATVIYTLHCVTCGAG